MEPQTARGQGCLKLLRETRCSAGFPTCRGADFPVGNAPERLARLGLLTVRRLENLRYGRLESLRYARQLLSLMQPWRADLWSAWPAWVC